MIRSLQKNYPVIILILVTLLFFAEVFTKGYMLEGPGDGIQCSTPNDIFELRSVRAGGLPLWNPHIYCGTPFLNSGYTNFYYPAQLLLYLFPERLFLRLLTLSAAAHIFFAGLFFMLFAQTVIRDRFWAMLSAMAYMLSSTLTFNFCYGNECTVVFTYMPLLLYIIASFKERTRLKNLISMAATISIILVSGNLQIITYMLALAFAYGLYRCAEFPGGRLRVNKALSGILLLSFASAVLITAVRTLPFLYSLRGMESAFSGTYKTLAEFDVTEVKALLRLFAPLFFIGRKGLFIAGLNANMSFNIYLGLAAAYFSLYGIIFVWNRETLFWKAAAAAIILIILDTPLTRLQYMMTGGAYLLFDRYSWLLPIPLAILFGITGRRVTESPRELKRAAVFAISVFISVTAALLLIHGGAAGRFGALARQNPAVYAALRGRFIGLFENMRHYLIYFITGSLCFISLLMSAKRRGADRRWIGLLLAAFVAADLIIMSRANVSPGGSGGPLLSARPLKELTENELYLSKKFLDEDKGFRIQGESENTIYNAAVRPGLYNVSGWNLIPSAYFSFLNGWEKINRTHLMGRLPGNQRMADLASVAYRVRPDGGIEFNGTYLPRAKLFGRYRVISDDGEARRALTDPAFDVSEAVIVESRPAVMPSGPADPGSARIIKDAGDRVLVSTDARTDSLLLLTDSYADGWSVYIDGARGEILRANIAFRAVAVPAGRHEILFTYRMPGLTAGALVSAAALAAFALFILYSLPRTAPSRPRG